MQPFLKACYTSNESRTRFLGGGRFGLVLAVLGLLLLLPVGLSTGAEANGRSGTSVSYSNDKVADVPWSIHVVKLGRSNTNYAFHTTLAKTRAIGLSTLSEQVKSLPPNLGHPVAAVNGDFWNERSGYAGDPMGLQIAQGELISAPGDRACFWIDPQGEPHIGTVLSLFKVTWPSGENVPIGLNSELTADGAVLYTPAIGRSTRTKKCREVIVEIAGDGGPGPLLVGQNYSLRVREVQENGAAPVLPGTMVLALGAEVANRLPAASPGSVLKLSTATSPSLTGVRTAIGGGPTLVRDGKAAQWNGHQTRHPRTAIGWNKTHFFLVQVDGRQRGLSVGMTFPELADYMLKLGCEQALNLDGGGSSTVWVLGRVVNSPCYGHEREMANALVLLYKDREEPADPD